MVIDEILNRKYGAAYTTNSLHYMYDCAELFGFSALSKAIHYGSNADIQREMCAYIDNEGYNPDIKKYVQAQDWLRFDTFRR